MDYLYLGTKYSRDIENKNGSAFTEAPYVVLHDKASKSSYAATSITDISSGAKTKYTFLFSANDTLVMKPGVYTLEIYVNASMEDMLYYERDFVKAIEVAATDVEESEESSIVDESSES